MSMMCVNFGLNSFLCRNLPWFALDMILIGMIFVIIGMILDKQGDKK